jgi:hypothetical protein
MNFGLAWLDPFKKRLRPCLAWLDPKSHWASLARSNAGVRLGMARTRACNEGMAWPAANRRAQSHRKVHRGWAHPPGNLGWITSQRTGAAIESAVITSARQCFEDGDRR